MASLPPQYSNSTQRPPPTRHDSSQETSSPSNERRDPLLASAASIDSQTLLLNTPGSTPPSEKVQEQPLERSAESEDNEPRKCWICFADETEDTPTSSIWRSPCPCALTAHESCLLDWVADLEAPSSRRAKREAPKIECPQCKATITIARPRSYVVDSVRAVDRAAGKLVLPGILFTVFGSLISGALLHGMTSVYLIFGQEDFRRLLLPPNTKDIGAKWMIGFPFIPIALIVSRTSLLEGILPVIPVIFFASSAPIGDISRSPPLWPPSAAMTMAMLPYVKSIYSGFYNHVFAERERRWIKAVQPRAGEVDDDGQGDGREVDDDDEDAAFGLDLELEIIHGAEPEPEPQQRQNPPAQNQNPVVNDDNHQNQPNNNDAPNDPAAPQIPAAAAPANPPPAPAANRANGLLVSTSRAVDAIIGALTFPAVCAAMGELLKLGLPSTWTTPVAPSRWGWGYRRPGLLQTKWGRSVVGGCLFVVMKDTLVLYSRYRVARDHGRRRVVDFEGERRGGRRRREERAEARAGTGS